MHSIKYIEHEELANLGEEGMSDILNIEDMIEKVQMTPNLYEQENLQKEMKALRLPLKV